VDPVVPENQEIPEPEMVLEIGLERLGIILDHVGVPFENGFGGLGPVLRQRPGGIKMNQVVNDGKGDSQTEKNDEQEI
jgi:hypothetical protein